MDAAVVVQIRAAFRAQPQAVRLADGVDRYFQDKILHQKRLQVNEAVFRDYKIRVVHDAVAKMIQFGQLNTQLLGIRLQAAAALNAGKSREITGEKQTLLCARKADEALEVRQVKVLVQADGFYIKMDVPKGADGRV